MKIAMILTGRFEEVSRRLKEMLKTSEEDGGVIYEGIRADDGTVCVTRCVIAGADRGMLPVEKIEIKDLDPAPSQALYNHSPNGFEWGYGGSGPAQLALAILIDATGDKELAIKYHQDFKERFVATWGKRWRINREQVRAFVLMKQQSDEIKEHFRGFADV